MWLGVAALWGFAIAGWIRVMLLGQQLQKHLREHHHQRWREIYHDDIIRKSLLWPFMKGTPVDFLWTSREDFGDAQVGDFRRRIHVGTLGVAAAAVAGLIWFGVIAFLLDAISKR
jgi:hypothetical protein